MEKVKITQEQATIIKEFQRKQREHFEKTKEDPIKFRVPEREMCLFDLETDEFMDALSIGYEVEPEFMKRGWVYIESYMGVKQLTTEVTSLVDSKVLRVNHKNLNGTDWNVPLSAIRHATPEEIATEKTRRWWAKHDREVWELKERDVLAYVDDVEVAQVTGIEGDRVFFSCGKHQISQSFKFVKKHMVIVCFAEDRKDI